MLSGLLAIVFISIKTGFLKEKNVDKIAQSKSEVLENDIRSGSCCVWLQCCSKTKEERKLSNWLPCPRTVTNSRPNQIELKLIEKIKKTTRDQDYFSSLSFSNNRVVKEKRISFEMWFHIAWTIVQCLSYILILEYCKKKSNIIIIKDLNEKAPDTVFRRIATTREKKFS